MFFILMYHDVSVTVQIHNYARIKMATNETVFSTFVRIYIHIRSYTVSQGLTKTEP